MSDLPFTLAEPLLPRLRAAADVEGKVVRALEALGPLAGHEVGFVDLPDGCLRDRLTRSGIDGLRVPISSPLAFDLPDASLDAVVTLWSAFRGVDERDLREADRVLRPRWPAARRPRLRARRRQPACATRDAPEYRVWSRRDGPFLATAGFKVRVVHCFWTFATARRGARPSWPTRSASAGRPLGAGLKRPRLSWNVAIYHRWRGGVDPVGRTRPPHRPRGRPDRRGPAAGRGAEIARGGPPPVPATLARMTYQYPPPAGGAAAARGAEAAARKPGPHLGPVRITPLRVTLLVALLGGSGSSPTRRSSATSSRCR